VIEEEVKDHDDKVGNKMKNYSSFGPVRASNSKTMGVS